jgi:hypothetical protein
LIYALGLGFATFTQCINYVNAECAYTRNDIDANLNSTYLPEYFG